EGDRSYRSRPAPSLPGTGQLDHGRVARIVEQHETVATLEVALLRGKAMNSCQRPKRFIDRIAADRVDQRAELGEDPCALSKYAVLYRVQLGQAAQCFEHGVEAHLWKRRAMERVHRVAGVEAPHVVD